MLHTVFVVACNAGVSCDSCMKGNFTGKRYKCLICYDYDLCASCFEAGTASSRHSADHPMQCILTRTDFGTLPFFCLFIAYIGLLPVLFLVSGEDFRVLSLLVWHLALKKYH